jgi:Mg2+-importing ATPase
MAKQKVIVKNIDSIQNLGAMNILCTDKTGTLTQDRIVLERYLDYRGKESDEVLEHAYLNSFHQTGLKSLVRIQGSRQPAVNCGSAEQLTAA